MKAGLPVCADFLVKLREEFGAPLEKEMGAPYSSFLDGVEHSAAGEIKATGNATGRGVRADVSPAQFVRGEIENGGTVTAGLAFDGFGVGTDRKKGLWFLHRF